MNEARRQLEAEAEAYGIDHAGMTSHELRQAIEEAFVTTDEWTAENYRGEFMGYEA